ncbi:electron transport complex subunit RsxG [Enterobacillus tribolii]|uniref:Ion-translocating oxidoreductase complex subunit G n=1 Tax=Enterobacillus tribolii TaxID=1487935 RepID=A0A370R3Y2_9GAMM|nr:electron transport complex subunit RsxG [Enterobacillus tribolii]MBW7984384.1 electron transport complex subunit RsxG [Enterobacillus tribolii]RDK97123.1 electron transport complex protein RnfG [Enterobacillus tribolii]
MLTTMRRHGITLAVFAAMATGLTAVVNQLTQGTIARQAEIQQQKLFDQVISPTLYNNALQEACYLVTDPRQGGTAPHRLYLARNGDEPVAAVVESTAPDGYSGAIQLLVAADFHGKVLGVRVLEHHETPGLGDKIDIRISGWIDSLRDKIVQGENDPAWQVKKDGGQFDQFTGATITPRAVVNEVRRTAAFLQSAHGQLDALPRCAGEKS